MTLVDTNILVDIATRNPAWLEASRRAFETCASRGPVLIIDIVFAEFAAGFPTASDCADYVEALGLEHSVLSREALWCAGQAFVAYRRRGGAKTNVLPDFFVGAHASVLGIPILTRDAARYRRYFPQVALIAPG